VIYRDAARSSDMGTANRDQNTDVHWPNAFAAPASQHRRTSEGARRGRIPVALTKVKSDGKSQTTRLNLPLRACLNG
jgi:hypothetical protein